MMFSIFVLTTLYRSIFSAGVSRDTINEYLALLLYLFKLVRVFHHPPIGKIAIRLHSASSVAVNDTISSECTDPLSRLSDPMSHLAESFRTRSSFSPAFIRSFILNSNSLLVSFVLFKSKRNPYEA